jgi:hypothetical protein
VIFVFVGSAFVFLVVALANGDELTVSWLPYAIMTCTVLDSVSAWLDGEVKDAMLLDQYQSSRLQNRVILVA